MSDFKNTFNKFLETIMVPVDFTKSYVTSVIPDEVSPFTFID